jgi:mannan endo-1,4-beta-mannosidase
VNSSEQTPSALPVSHDSATDQRDEPTGLILSRRPFGSPHEGSSAPTSADRRGSHRTAVWVSVIACVLLLLGIAIPFALKMRSTPSVNATQQVRYIGVYDRSSSSSSAGLTAFTTATGIRPNVLTYYSSWLEPFQTDFAVNAAEHEAIPLVQINPFGVSLAKIASGQYDDYLSTYAKAVRAYRHSVIVSFGHEMNGSWYPWGNTHTSPIDFVAAWRHIVVLFRQAGAHNVIWLWTANIIETGGIPSPAVWWPGNSYVTWVGLDGYYYEPSWTFSSLFGPTITAIRELTHDPILIAETGAVAGARQPSKIADLFAGIRLYGLLGFVWFNAVVEKDWRISGPAAFATFRQNAKAYYRPIP